MKLRSCRDWGISIGSLPPGPKNTITDVPGVLVGHCTLDEGPVKTGVTAVLPHSGNLFQEKVPAAAHVINGFGKTTGLLQMEEMGTLETPLVLTNTLSVGTAYQGLLEYMLVGNPDIGETTGTVNPVVAECNDGYLNDIRGCHIKKKHVLEAIAAAGRDFAQGSVGAGTGMSCFGLKGGIGSAARSVELEDQSYVVGILVLSNFGRKKDLIIAGNNVGRLIAAKEKEESSCGGPGSIIVVLATDVPLAVRQLKRLCKRATIGLIRTGSPLSSGSGDLVLGFTTANRAPHDPPQAFAERKTCSERFLDLLFQAVGEAVEEAILNSLFFAASKTGRAGHERRSITEYLDLIFKR